ncbi:Hypothetical predicted protein [Marmota monax]|uniref:Ig-like domain-containing protein n=1 Tax=Marmota monax TaxID=9995 RepID=A0A5E4BPQ5_MARMO|nr:hypothetical protein GHT09_007768 [Marmota monax]VTJ71040.1 Hypothetical predicted protein [Marmota monax]
MQLVGGGSGQGKKGFLHESVSWCWVFSGGTKVTVLGVVTVDWKRDGTKVTQGVQNTQPSKQTNNKYMASSYLTVTADKSKSHNSYTCQVTREGSTVDKTVSPSQCS